MPAMCLGTGMNYTPTLYMQYNVQTGLFVCYTLSTSELLLL